MILEKIGVDVSAVSPFALAKQGPQGSEEPPVLSLIRGLCMMFAMKHRDALKENGVITGQGNDASELFQAILDHPEGIHLCDTEDESNLDVLKTDDRRIHLAVPMILEMLGNTAPFPMRSTLPTMRTSHLSPDRGAHELHRQHHTARQLVAGTQAPDELRENEHAGC
jgi:hypothetical protein